MIKILGVHSNVSGNAGLADGHAWITLHFSNGRSASVGLWTADLKTSRRFIRDPIGFMNGSGENFDVEWNSEISLHYETVTRRYYGLNEHAAKQAVKAIGEYQGWRFTNTCATWATNVVKKVTGEELRSKEAFGLINTPRALAKAIEELEKTQRTYLQAPKMVVGNPF